jgi:hypothetical protein
MTAEEHGDASQNDQPGPAAWRLRTSEKAIISAAAGLVADARALGQYINPGDSGIPAFGISLGISTAARNIPARRPCRYRPIARRAYIEEVYDKYGVPAFGD